MPQVKAKIGVIGGTGLYDIDGLTSVKEVNLDTPFGPPSGRRRRLLLLRPRSRQRCPNSRSPDPKVQARAGWHLLIRQGRWRPSLPRRDEFPGSSGPTLSCEQPGPRRYYALPAAE